MRVIFTWWPGRVAGPLNRCIPSAGIRRVPVSFLQCGPLSGLGVKTIVEVLGCIRATLLTGSFRTVCIRTLNLDRPRSITAITFALRGWGSILSKQIARGRAGLLVTNSLILNSF